MKNAIIGIHSIVNLTEIVFKYVLKLVPNISVFTVMLLNSRKSYKLGIY